MARLLMLFSLCIPQLVFAQSIDKYHNDYQKDFAIKNRAGMSLAGSYMADHFPDEHSAYLYSSYAKLLENKLAQSHGYLEKAKSILPVDPFTYRIEAYYHFVKGAVDIADKKLRFAYQLQNETDFHDRVQQEINLLEEMLSKDFSTIKKTAHSANEDYQRALPIQELLKECAQNWKQGRDCTTAEIEAFYNSQSPKNSEAPIALKFKEVYVKVENDQVDNLRPLLEQLISKDIYSKHLSYYQQAYLYNALTFFDSYDDKRMLTLADKGLKAVQKLNMTTRLECDLLTTQMIALERSGMSLEVLDKAKALLTKSETAKYPLGQADAHNVIGLYHLDKNTEESVLLANHHLATAYKLTKGNTELADQNSLFASNYAMVLWKMNNTAGAKILIMQNIRREIENRNYHNAQTQANSLGYMMMSTKDYTGAINMFRKAINITEQHLEKQSASERLATLDAHSNAYSGLINVYAETNNPQALFQIQDMNRSRLLSSKLSTKKKRMTVAKVQELLAPEEVLLYYSEISPGEMIVSVVTNNNIHIAESYPIEDWLRIKREHLNAVTKTPVSVNGYITKLNEEVIDGKVYSHKNLEGLFRKKDYDNFITVTRELLQTDDLALENVQRKFLSFCYRHLIAPIKSSLAGKSSLLISGEGGLNYLPFEAFIGSDGKYLIEHFDIRYIPSASVWSDLQKRNYENNRKPLLAMGGAQYQPPVEKKGKVTSNNKLYEIQDIISTKVKSNTVDLSQELEILGFGGAKYLPGTLLEVENLQQIIPEATVMIGQEMKESDLKKMDKAGKLANYKYIHLATHGFAMDRVPEFSGLMMTQPNGGDKPEDMFLLAYEIEQLNIKADLTVLSACETALGKSYGGEGVNGLNSALLVAGSNSTLLSLWPVNDAGTMIFMTELYNNLYTRKQSVAQATNNAKRTILSGTYGDQFTSPVIWAPFILSGR